MLRQLLILDTETTGTTHAVDCPVEVGIALYSVPDLAVLKAASWLIDARTYRGDALENIKDISGDVHGITPAMWQQGAPWAKVEGWVRQASAQADAIVAHNSDFDRGWFRDEVIQATAWIDTCDGIEWPRPTRYKSLDHLSMEFLGYAVNGHRALADVLTLAKLLTAAGKLTDLSVMLERGLRPRGLYAVVDEPRFDTKRNELAKGLGFRWDADRKEWLRKMADEDAAGLPFKVRKVVA